MIVTGISLIKTSVFLIFCLSAFGTVLCFDNDVMFGDLVFIAAMLMILFFCVMYNGVVECFPLILDEIVATKRMNI